MHRKHQIALPTIVELLGMLNARGVSNKRLKDMMPLIGDLCEFQSPNTVDRIQLRSSGNAPLLHPNVAFDLAIDTKTPLDELLRAYNIRRNSELVSSADCLPYDQGAPENGKYVLSTIQFAMMLGDICFVLSGRGHIGATMRAAYSFYVSVVQNGLETDPSRIPDSGVVLLPHTYHKGSVIVLSYDKSGCRWSFTGVDEPYRFPVGTLVLSRKVARD